MPTTDITNDCDAYPTDDHNRTMGEIEVLNRIDQEYGCDRIIGYSQWSGNEYCGIPEWDPFSGRCAEHSPDNGGWNA